jgi:hypothetical protein
LELQKKAEKEKKDKLDAVKEQLGEEDLDEGDEKIPDPKAEAVDEPQEEEVEDFSKEEDVVDEEAAAQDIIEDKGYAAYYFSEESRNNAFDYLELGNRFFYISPFDQVRILY